MPPIKFKCNWTNIEEFQDGHYGNSESLHCADVISMRLNSIKVRARPCGAVGNVSGYRCVSDCRSRGREFNPGPVPYFRGD